MHVGRRSAPTSLWVLSGRGALVTSWAGPARTPGGGDVDCGKVVWTGPVGLPWGLLLLVAGWMLLLVSQSHVTLMCLSTIDSSLHASVDTRVMHIALDHLRALLFLHAWLLHFSAVRRALTREREPDPAPRVSSPAPGPQPHAQRTMQRTSDVRHEPRHSRRAKSTKNTIACNASRRHE